MRLHFFQSAETTPDISIWGYSLFVFTIHLICLEFSEKKYNFAFGNQRRAPLYERHALFIRKAHQTTQVLHARMLRTLQTKV